MVICMSRYALMEMDTVNLEIFVRVSFSRNFANARFSETKTLAKWLNHSVVY